MLVAGTRMPGMDLQPHLRCDRRRYCGLAETPKAEVGDPRNGPGRRSRMVSLPNDVLWPANADMRGIEDVRVAREVAWITAVGAAVDVPRPTE